MKRRFKKTLFIFRRDLRLEDNTGLLFALEHSDEVLPAFIFTPDQIQHNPYRSDHCLQFMLESLEDLEKALLKKGGSLFLFYDTPENVVEACIEKEGVDAVVVNGDYTPYSLARDKKMEAVCKAARVPFHSFDDALLNAPEKTLKKDGTPYTVFTPFHRNALQFPVKEPILTSYERYCASPVAFSVKREIYHDILPKRVLTPSGGREKALALLSSLQKFGAYASLRDFPAQQETTHLSSHLKFTTCSVREVYHAIKKALGPSSEIIRSLYWRDFFTSIAYYFPHVFTSSFHKKYDALTWDNDEARFSLWCQGKTGFPFVDAGMREMNATGFMHNRARMIAASFLVKDLHIDWRWGERYFATMLIDYDPAVNNGNWQWAASTGCDAQPYFRIFNPWRQSARFDPDCLYIKRWVPELGHLDPKTIHEWFKESNASLFYPRPIVDHSKESAKTLAHYKETVS